jgi:hypothetical protein
VQACGIGDSIRSVAPPARRTDRGLHRHSFSWLAAARPSGIVQGFLARLYLARSQTPIPGFPSKVWDDADVARTWLIWLLAALIGVALFGLGILGSIVYDRLGKPWKISTSRLVALSIAPAAAIGVLGQFVTDLGNDGPPSAAPSFSAAPYPLPPSGWKLAAHEEFAATDAPVVGGNEWVCEDGSTSHGSGSYMDGRLLLRVDSSCNYTYQVGYELQPRSVGPQYYFAADVEYVSGPADGYCVLLAGWEDSEHWYAFKLNRDAFEVTRNRGSLPHQSSVHHLRSAEAQLPVTSPMSHPSSI